MPGRRRSGTAPAWALKLGSGLASFAVFAGSFGYANTHLYATNAPLQPAVVETIVVTVTPTPASATTTLTSNVRTTTRAAVTRTRSS